jgi:hypothetical protein
MPLPQPNLDDLTYADLVEEARSLIPGLAPEWTDHNPTDPGIVLIELLAWLTEITLYRVNRVPEANYRTFLALLREDNSGVENVDLRLAIQDTVLQLRSRYRTITTDDFIQVIVQDWPHSPEIQALADTLERSPHTLTIERVKCLSNTDLTNNFEIERPGHISLLVVPKRQGQDPHPMPSSDLLGALESFVKPRCLLATYPHVVAPDYKSVSITASLMLMNDTPSAAFPSRAEVALMQFFDPLVGGPDGQGWPFGRGVYASDVFQMLDQVPGVDYVSSVEIRYPTTSSNPVAEVLLSPHQLVKLISSTFNIGERR